MKYVWCHSLHFTPTVQNSELFCIILYYLHSFAYCMWIEISFPKNLHYSNWIYMMNALKFCCCCCCHTVINIYFCHSMAQRQCACIEAVNVQIIELRSSFQWNILLESWLWLFLCWCGISEPILAHSIYSQSISIISLAFLLAIGFSKLFANRYSLVEIQ